MSDTVTVTAECPGCGRDATWRGSVAPGGGTRYCIDCASCEGWTARAQLHRWINRVAA